MKPSPCEYIAWNVLPIIRKLIAECMIKNYGLKQKETAEKLGLTPAAVSQYLSGKRGRINSIDKNTLKEINITAERIIQQGEEVVVAETCRLCKIFLSKNLFNLKKD